MALPVLTPPPPVPSLLNNPADFVAMAEAWLAWQAVNRAEMAAWAAALPANITGTDFSGTSTSSVLIGTGAKSLTASTGKQWQIGQPIRIARTSAPANYMDCQVTAYNPTTGALTANCTGVGGSGTFTDWTISLLPSGSGFATQTGVETLTNKTLTGNVIASFTNAGFTITMPTSTTTLVGRDTTDTLTNKTLDFGVGGNVIKLNGNTFAASAGTATITFPNTTTRLVGRDTTDTLTGKTMSGDTFNADNVVNDTGTIATNSVGFRGVPKSANATGTLILSDNGKFIDMAGNWTIPANASVAFPIGAVVEFLNNSASTRTIGITSDTMYWSGVGSTGARTISARGRAWAQKVSSTEWYIAGDLS